MTAEKLTVVQRGRVKAYRPIPDADRAAALTAGIAAYERGDFFEAHELLEPAWMGTDDLAERALYQGLIKLAAAFVHGVRGNPTGIARNLEGARGHLAAAAEAAADGGPSGGLDLPALVSAVDERVTLLAADPSRLDVDPPPLTRSRP